MKNTEKDHACKYFTVLCPVSTASLRQQKCDRITGIPDKQKITEYDFIWAKKKEAVRTRLL